MSDRQARDAAIDWCHELGRTADEHDECVENFNAGWRLAAALDASAEDDLDAFSRRLNDVFGHVTQLLISKRRSYGAANLTRFGGLGIVIRASDTIDGLAAMCGNDSQRTADGESRRDAWRDLIGYAALGLLHDEDGGR